MHLSDIKLYFFSGRGLLQQEKHLYMACYETWKMTWSQTFKELKGSNEIFSDAFTRQDKICGLFYQETCIGTMSLRTYDFSLDTSKEDSIFSSWDEEALKLLTKDGSQIMVCSYLASHPSFRREILPQVNLKNVLLYLAAKELVSSEAFAMAGTTRCNRGVNTAALATGARFLKKSQMYGVEVDLIAWYKTELLNKLNYSVGDYIWNSRQDFTEVESDRRLKVA